VVARRRGIWRCIRDDDVKSLACGDGISGL
jgi:hypothetical protein